MFLGESPDSAITEPKLPSASVIPYAPSDHHVGEWLTAPELSARENLDRSGFDRAKRVADVIGATLLLTTLSPAMLIVAGLVKLTSSGPAVYAQKRLTKGGQIFTMFKFRTMAAGAEDRTGAVWAQSSDPRITKLGKILRKTRLDELPQLINVLRGEMSLIGPRPERPEFTNLLEKELPGFSRRLAVRAGITGLAQVTNGYAACSEGHRQKLLCDLYYIENRSVLLDLKIAAKTILTILTGQGAR